MKVSLVASLGAACLAGGMLPAVAQAQVSAPEAQVNALEGLFGKQAGFRRSHAKGVCASGYFVGNAAGRSLSSATVFSGDRVPVVARFSAGGGNPKVSEKGRSVRGLAVQFSPANGEVWLTATISAPMYFVRTPEQFPMFFQVRTPDPATGKPDPEKLKAFNEANPETTVQAAWLAKQAPPASYGTASYFSTNAFELVNGKNERQFVRWQFAPDAGVIGLTDDQAKALPDEFLADELRKRVGGAPVEFTFNLQLAQAGDQVIDSTKVWPDDRRVVPAGKLVITKVEAAGEASCDKITFNPLVLPKGIQASNDPVLLARPAPYGLSLGRRLTEGAK